MFTKLKTIYIFIKFAEIAQSVEQRIENPRVTSSILVLGIISLGRCQKPTFLVFVFMLLYFNFYPHLVLSSVAFAFLLKP